MTFVSYILTFVVFNNLLAFLSLFSFDFHVICLSEIFIYSNEQTYFPIPGYVF